MRKSRYVYNDNSYAVQSCQRGLVMNPANIKGTNKDDATIYVGRSTKVHNLLFASIHPYTVHELRNQNISVG